WTWGDGATDTNLTPKHVFTSASTYTNRLTVSTPTALIGFGVGCQTNAWTNTLTRVWGLTNYPSLQDIFFYLARISELSLAGCSNLTHVALAGSSHNLSTNVENLWFSDLAAAQAGGKPNGISALCDGNI